MDIELIKVPKEEAKVKLEAYRKRLRKMKLSKANQEVAEEYRAAVAGYEALEKGYRLLDLDGVFTETTLDEKCRPKLAICRADRKQVRFHWNRWGERASFMCAKYNTWNSIPEGLICSVNMGRRHGMAADVDGWAIVPMIPADVRPTTGQLKEWHILWEVEQWADKATNTVPDRDPYLLKHLGGSLYAVLAEWDLTDLERAIMKGRVS